MKKVTFASPFNVMGTSRSGFIVLLVSKKNLIVGYNFLTKMTQNSNVP